MFAEKSIAVVLPCYNEQTQITGVLEGLPDFIDKAFVIDDASRDDTSKIVSEYAQTHPKVHLERLEKNSGVGAAIARGYVLARDEGFDITLVMGGDGQMDPEDLPHILNPLVNGQADYVKGNRFFYLQGQGVKKIPPIRLFGNFCLSALTKIVSGYWHVSDSQCGYTGINKDAINAIEVEDIYPRYGCPNDILTKLNIAQMRVAEVPVNPLYGVGEESKMRIPRIILPMLKLMANLFVQRMVQKYIFRTGHPLVLAYMASLLLACVCVGLTGYITAVSVMTGLVPKVALIACGFGAILSVQLALSAFEMDFNYNRELNVELHPSFGPPKQDAHPDKNSKTNTTND